MRKTKKVLLLVHPKFRPDLSRSQGGTEMDVWRTLKRDFNIEVAAADQDVRRFDRELASFRPDVVFNLIEEFRGEAIYDFHLISYLESLGLAYTGCNPRGLIQSRNKFLVGQIASSLGVRVPRAILVGDGAGQFGRIETLRPPLFVKLNREHASLGIRETNYAISKSTAAVEIRRMRKAYEGQILVQEFVPGREVSVALWGNQRIELFRPRELKMEGEGRVSTERVKFNRGVQIRRKIRSMLYVGSGIKEILKSSKIIYSALDLNGYARFDFRVNQKEEAFMIDVNSNPNLAVKEDFALSGRDKGYSYREILHEVLSLGMTYQPKF